MGRRGGEGGRECEVEGTASAKDLGWEIAKAKTGLWGLGEMFLDEVREEEGVWNFFSMT